VSIHTSNFVALFCMSFFAALCVILPFRFALRYKNKSFNDDGISFPHGFVFAFTMFIYASLVAAVASYVYFQFIDKGFYFENILQGMDELSKSDSANAQMNNMIETMKQAVTAYQNMDNGSMFLAISIFNQCMVGGLIVSLVIAAIIRKNPKQG